MKKLFLSITLLSVMLVSAKTVDPIKINADYTSYYSTNVNSFCKLIQMGNYEIVESLIKQGADVNLKSMGLTPLMFAARHNKAKIAELLINNGAKLRAKSTKGFTALKWAELSNANATYKIIEAALENQKRK